MIILYLLYKGVSISALTDTDVASLEVARILFTQMTWRTDLLGLAGMLTTTTGWSGKQRRTCAFIFVTIDHLHQSALSTTIPIRILV